MNASDLQPFCYEHSGRPNIRQPFSRGDFTFATNGALIVRVPRLEDVGEEGGVDIEKINGTVAVSGREPFQIDDIEKWEAAPKFPTVSYKEVCEDCYEAGRVKDTCGTCSGLGVLTAWDFDCTAVKIGHRHFGPKLLFTLLRLPNLEFAPAIGAPEEPINFRFDGGCGVLMPLRITDPDRSKIFPPQ